ncbi:MAG: hypothetical protein HYV07_24295 [Deltaproteobacteria bacterium]|nr:hypothetical protein [Deltaproteobacteria bacterium]
MSRGLGACVLFLLGCAQPADVAPRLPNGTFRELHQNGLLAAERHFDKGLAVGKWRSWSEDGVLLTELSFSRGRASGPMSVSYADGRPATRARYRNGQLIGTREVFFESGDHAAIDRHVAGLPDGLHVRFWANGRPMRANEYDRGRKDGLAIMWNRRTGKIAEILPYSGGSRDGYGIRFIGPQPEQTFYHRDLLISVEPLIGPFVEPPSGDELIAELEKKSAARPEE